jgi:hypothetical protein
MAAENLSARIPGLRGGWVSRTCAAYPAFPLYTPTKRPYLHAPITGCAKGPRTMIRAEDGDQR